MPRRRWCAWIAVPAMAHAAVAGLEMRIETGKERVRPYEHAAIQIRPSLPEGAQIRVVDRDGGWLSKPFRQEGGATAVLYTAPGKPGKYVIEARVREARLEVEIEVDASAPSHRPGEAISFGPKSEARDFYRDLAEHYAPLVTQETWFEPKADFLTRFDYDGDWRGDNNWDNLPQGTSQAYVYYSAMETATHHFLVYNFFHPRHYSDNCSGGGCHENDNGGMVLAVRKDGSKYGRLEAMETLNQNTIYVYTAEPRIREGTHRISGQVKLWRDSHPVVFIESGSHGVYAGGDAEHSRFSVDRMEFTTSTGVVYRYGGAAARPSHANDREVSYELLAMTAHLWPRATSAEGRETRTFDEYYRYTPNGNRPAAVAEEVGGAFFGRKLAPNKAKPFWGWHDTLTLTRKILALGQWGLDPAYAISVTMKFPPGVPFALDYIYNPYLQGGGRKDAVTLLTRASRSADGSDSPPRPTGERRVLSPPADKPNYNLKSKQGHLEFRGRVDGSLYLYVRGDQIEVEYLSGRPMDEIRYRFSQPLPAMEMAEVKLEDVDGRGSVRLLEWPNAGNQYTAKIRIQDEKPGAANYKLKLVWKR